MLPDQNFEFAGKKNIPIKPAIFLDRDGVLIEDVNYLSKTKQINILPGVLEGLIHLQMRGFFLVVVTNQAGVGRGYFTESTLKKIHGHLNNRFRKHFIEINIWKYCPHHPTAGLGKYRIDCNCRKPKPGMILDAAEELSINLNKSYLIGDKICDIEAALKANVQPILVKTGHGNKQCDLVRNKYHPHVEIAENFSEACKLVFKNSF